MNVIQTELPGVLIIEPKVFGDNRGFFKEVYQAERYAEVGISMPFVQDNHSRSKRGVLRGLHLQEKRPQGKLVSCSLGSVFDVAADINPSSETFGQHVAVELSDKNHLQLWIPPKYAHGFCVVSPEAVFQYKCTDFYFPNDENGLIWNDPDLKIDWPISAPNLSEKDLKLPTLQQIKEGAEK